MKMNAMPDSVRNSLTGNHQSKLKSGPLRLAVVAQVNTAWAAGQYYIENVLAAASGIAQVEITVLTDYGSKPTWILPQLKNRKIHYRALVPEYSFAERTLNRIGRQLARSNIFERRVKYGDFDMVFPEGRVGEYPFLLLNRHVYWIPDFQERHYPANFSAMELEQRERQRSAIAASQDWLVLSSEAALNDFKRYFPEHRCRVFVLPFRVFHPEAVHDESVVLSKFGLSPNSYFLCSNQFWKHKNHSVIIEALRIVQMEQPDSNCKVVFTGRETGFSNEGAAQEARSLVDEYRLKDRVVFLGFIDRSDQLVLMHHARALLQPSLFEGWNTSIEDALSLGCPVLASDIPVHREQLTNPRCLVAPTDAQAWANAMVADNVRTGNAINYDDARVAFQEKLLELILNVRDHG